MSVDFRIPSVIEIRSVSLHNSWKLITTIWARSGKDRGCRCFRGPLGSLGIAPPLRSTGIDGSFGGASCLCTSIYVEPDGMLVGVSLR
uniref:Uncharacterized protein n=1 Tax=Chromera velia CCMP2878 TaxID=1169474 RepID=A0A0G4H9F7_9ALVE|eukprot:Cvel_25296.t1-p1 / transcript=Cvel_25296.t1 / gene=Cvel_25296 / organism=Chromera_velia_CCMP2878 / gene_product=hypothetical protein / transcript_product=hypothetical protein / location=Cvel_scaffold2844:16431-18537(-) / protein_length=87 / sequence_SO=supercontig / SO=protein_coding / is_pseudo=false